MRDGIEIPSPEREEGRGGEEEEDLHNFNF